MLRCLSLHGMKTWVAARDVPRILSLSLGYMTTAGCLSSRGRLGFPAKGQDERGLRCHRSPPFARVALRSFVVRYARGGRRRRARSFSLRTFLRSRSANTRAESRKSLQPDALSFTVIITI